MVLKARSAGEVQAMTDFLATHHTSERLIVLSHGVGEPRDIDLAMAHDALEQEVPCAVYTLNVSVSPERRRRAREFGVEIREYDVFHELLTDALHAAGLPGPAKELAAMHAADYDRQITAEQSGEARPSTAFRRNFDISSKTRRQ